MAMNRPPEIKQIEAPLRRLGQGNQLIVPLAEQPNHEGPIACRRERLDGLLKFYCRQAA